MGKLELNRRVFRYLMEEVTDGLLLYRRELINLGGRLVGNEFEFCM